MNRHHLAHPAGPAAALLMILFFSMLAGTPAEAQPFLRMDIEESPVGPRSLVLWPPSCPDPGSLTLLFGPDGPITMPFFVRVGESDPWCEPMFPLEGFVIEYLLGRSHQDGVVFAEPAGHVAGPTNENGYAGVLLPLLGGGHAEGPQAFWLRAPGIICAYNLDMLISVNSPDIDADLIVNLTDVVLWSMDYFQGYHYRSDLFWDGQINLSDLVYLARALGTY
jgi:hypothetical protein